MSETPDTRDPIEELLDPPRRPPPMLCNRGEGAELRVFLEEALQIPKGVRRFSVTFEIDQAVIVNVDYIPRESC